MKYGFNGGLYLNSGTYSTPTWVDLTNTKEVQIEDGMSEHDATLRVGGGLTLSEPILRSITFTGKILVDTADTSGYVALYTAYNTRAELDVLALDAKLAVNGAEGYRLGMKNFTFNQGQGNDDLVYRDFTLKPCISVNAAKRVSVASGTPTFTSITA